MREIERLRREIEKLKGSKKKGIVIVIEDNGVYYSDMDGKRVVLSEDDLNALEDRYSHLLLIRMV